MNSICRSIFSMLALYAAEGRSALTLDEIHLYLHKPENNPLKPTGKEISDCLSELNKKNIVFKEGDYYSLENRAGFAGENIKKSARSVEKIKKNKWPLVFLRAIPFIRAIAVTGSVAMNNAAKKSDLDLLIVVERERIWTARIFALLIIELFSRRRENPKKPEKICLNFFATRDKEIPIQNIAMANMLRRAMPLYGGDAFAEFLNKNSWMKKFLYNDGKTYAAGQRTPLAARLLERCLNEQTGDWLEKFFKDWQYRRLVKKITTPQNLDHFILTDEILMLHYPDPKNTQIMEKYTRAVNNLI